MECCFNIATRIGASSDHEGTYVGRLDQRFIRSDNIEEVTDLIDVLCDASAQKLETSVPAIRNTEDTVYLLVEGCVVLGLARVGVRRMQASPPSVVSAETGATTGGYQSESQPDSATGVKGRSYSAHLSQLQTITPCALLDFFIIGGFQRRGLGRLLFDAVLAGEEVVHPAKLVYLNPSVQLQCFLEKHFLMTGSRKADIRSKHSNFLLFDDYFKEAALSDASPAVASNVKATSKPVASVAVDEPKIEEEEEDEIDVYKKDEDEIYTEIGKLYRFIADECKWDAGVVGKVSLLKQRASVRARLVFQLESTKQIVLNHFILNQAGYCQLQHIGGNEKTWVWTAQCRVLEERVAIKFKSIEIASHFKEVFDKAKPPRSDAIEYIVMQIVGSTQDLDLRSRHIKLFSAGDVVQVVDVQYLADVKRVRACIAHPHSWITILSHNEVDAGCYAVERKSMERYSETMKRQ